MPKKLTYSIIVETENLGMAEFSDLEHSLNSIKRQHYSISQIKEVILIVGGHLSERITERIKKKYPWVRVHMEKTALDYARSKMRGAEVARGDVVIFADSDMQYEPSWLGSMITTVESHSARAIVSGDTRLDTTSAYSMALNATWMIQVLSDRINVPVPTHFFPLNNFAIHRRLILTLPIPYTLPLYRNKIPLWEAQLVQAGCQIVRAPGSRGHHAPPGTLGDWFWRMLIYGADFVAQADFSVTPKGSIREKQNMGGRLYQLCLLAPWKVEQLLLNTYKLLREDWRRLSFLPGALLIGLTNCCVIILGGLLALISRDFVFHRINAREAIHVV
jgi:glycosyltransferase involved in cell wall biosynthesis